MTAIDQLSSGIRTKSYKKDNRLVKKTNYKKGDKVKSSDNWLTAGEKRTPVTRRTIEGEFKNRGMSFSENIDEFNNTLKEKYSEQAFMPYSMEDGKYYKHFPKSFQINESGEKTGVSRLYLDSQTGYAIDYSKKQKSKLVQPNLISEKSSSDIPKLADGGVPGVDELTDTSGNPGGGSALSPDILSQIADLIQGANSEIVDAKKEKIQMNYDYREDPTEALEESNRLDTGKSLLGGAAKGAAAGAAMGSVIPGLGTAIGAGIGTLGGTLVSGIGRLLGKETRDLKIDEAKKQWSSHWTDRAASYANTSGYKEGGKIEGKGSSKSDSISMTAKDDSFIVPAENSKAGMEIGKTYLGWKENTTADRKNSGSALKVSDGEVLYTPEEVGILKYHGIDLNQLAPNAEPGHEMGAGGFQDGTGPPGGSPMSGRKLGSCTGMKDGGWIYDKDSDRVTNEGNTIQYDNQGNEYKIGTSGEFELFNEKAKHGTDIYSEFSGKKLKKEKEEKENERNIFDYIPELAGTLQLAGGAAGLMEAGKKPDIYVSRTLKKLSAETRRLANFGYEPAVLNALNTQIEKSRRDMTREVTRKGGSAMENMEKMKSILSTTLDKKAGIVFQNAQEKARKWTDVLKVDMAKSGQEFEIDKINLADWYKTQDVFANLLSAGVNNIVGARQLKDQQDVIRETGTSKPTFT